METFSEQEVGLSHRTQPIAVRLLDDGRIAIIAGDNGEAGIILNSKDGSVMIYGSVIDFVSDEIRLDGKSIVKSVLTSSEKIEWKEIASRGNMKANILRSKS
jgi:hypothetical protein